MILVIRFIYKYYKYFSKSMNLNEQTLNQTYFECYEFDVNVVLYSLQPVVYLLNFNTGDALILKISQRKSDSLLISNGNQYLRVFLQAPVQDNTEVFYKLRYLDFLENKSDPLYKAIFVFPALSGFTLSSLEPTSKSFLIDPGPGQYRNFS